MATVVEDNLPTIDAGRALLQEFGLRPVRVFMRTKVWSAAERHLGTLTESDVELLPRPKVKGDNQRLTVTNVTPRYTGGGWTPEMLQPDLQAGYDHVFIVQQPDGALNAYRLAKVDQLSPFRYTLELEALERAEPDF